MDNNARSDIAAIGRLIRRAGVQYGLLVAAFLLFLITVLFPEIWSLSTWGGEDGNRSEVLRNIALILLGAIGLPLAAWRSWVAARQTEISERSMFTDRYQRAAQMLGDETISVRQAGIYALRDLATADPANHYVLVQQLLCGFVRQQSQKIREASPSFEEHIESEKKLKMPQMTVDMEDALNTFLSLRARTMEAKSLESAEGWTPNLDGAWFVGHVFFSRDEKIDLTEINLSNASFDLATVSADFRGSNLTNSTFKAAEIVRSDFRDTRMMRVKFTRSSISGTDFENRIQSCEFLDSSIGKQTFVDCHFGNCGFNRTTMFSTSFWRSHFVGSTFGAAIMENCEFVDCDLNGVANFSDCLFCGIDFHGSNGLEPSKFQHTMSCTEYTPVNIGNKDVYTGERLNRDRYFEERYKRTFRDSG